MKKTLIFMIVAVSLMLMCSFAYANSMEFTVGNNTVYINNKGIISNELETAPYIENDRTMVPIRVISENFGAQVNWDEINNAVSIKSDDKDISLTINSNVAYVNGEERILDVPATELNGRTMVPVRFVSEALGYDVDYTDVLETIYITNEQPIMTVDGHDFNIDDYNSFFKMFANGATESDYNNVVLSANNFFQQIVAFSNHAKDEDTMNEEEYFTMLSQIKENSETIKPLMFLSSFVKISKLYESALGYTNNIYKGITDEEINNVYNSDYISAKHILIMTIDNQTGEALPDKEKKAAKDKASNLLKKIKNGTDFDKLMNENSEDSGLKSNPDGYVFTKGMMVKEFEDAAYALDIDKVSDLVETTYGYHIIKRQALPEITEDVKAGISATLSNEKIISLFSELSKELNVTQNKSPEEVCNLL